MVHTHYPRERQLGIEIMEQESRVELCGEFPVVVPYFMREIIEEMSPSRGRASTSTSSRASAQVSASPTTARWGHALHRGAILGERPAVPRSATWGTFIRRRWASWNWT